MEKTKVCSKCKGDPKPLSEFWFSLKTGRYGNCCKTCNLKRLENYKKTNPQEYKRRCRNNHLMRIYGITPGQYEDLYLFQEGKCAICGIHQDKLKVKLSVDHDHETGEVRGLLCYKCNTAIGLLNDDSYTILKAWDYLDKYKKY